MQPSEFFHYYVFYNAAIFLLLKKSHFFRNKSIVFAIRNILDRVLTKDGNEVSKEGKN